MFFVAHKNLVSLLTIPFKLKHIFRNKKPPYKHTLIDAIQGFVLHNMVNNVY